MWCGYFLAKEKYLYPLSKMQEQLHPYVNWVGFISRHIEDESQNKGEMLLIANHQLELLHQLKQDDQTHNEGNGLQASWLLHDDKVSQLLQDASEITASFIRSIYSKRGEATMATPHALKQDLAKLQVELQETERLLKTDRQQLLSWLNIAVAVIAILTLLLLFWGVRLFQIHILKPYQQLRGKLSRMTKSWARGQNRIPDAGRKGRDSIINQLEGIENKLELVEHFADSIGEGKYEFDLGKDSETVEDALVNKFIVAQDKLKAAALRDKQSNWVNSGLAHFSDILRDHFESQEDLAQAVLSKLVQYVEGNQGAIFLKDIEDPESLVLAAAYAWGRRKANGRKISVHEGLLGTCLKDGAPIFLTDIPDDFVHISSGLGHANPKNVLLLPIQFNEKYYGVIEIASFQELEQYQVDFIAKLTENIGSALYSLIENQRTKQLLLKSQELTEQLKNREEELRHNAEELEASKEVLNVELSQAKAEMEENVKEIEEERAKNIAILEGCEDGVVMFDRTGKVEFFNKAAEDIWQTSREEVLGNNIQRLVPVVLPHETEDKTVLYASNGILKPIDVRTEISIGTFQGGDTSVLVTLAKGETKQQVTYAFFVQRISVELF